MNKTISYGLTFDDVLLVPKKTYSESRKEIDISSHLTPKIKLRTPIISANMDTVTESTMAIEMAKMGGIGFIHRFNTIDEQVSEVKKVKKEELLVGAAIGIKDDYLERTHALIEAGVDVIVIDIAHGHSEFMIKALHALKKQFKKMEFIAGNIATYEAAEELIKNGADAVKVGIGPGALCSTRVVTGAGVPQITAVMNAVEAAAKHKVPVVADGGTRYSGDFVKALAAGASTVMVGTMFASCEESPGKVVHKDGKDYKIARGMASMSANVDRQKKDSSVKKDLTTYAAEGVEMLVPCKGRISDLMNNLISSIKSGFSYCGAKNIEEVWKNAEFIQISQSALIESHPHTVFKT
jgi:IMP dehydrogenase